MKSDVAGQSEFYALTYDASVPDWPGEIDFYKEYASEATSGGLPVLELACGTGRVALKLARAGHEVVGLDSSPAMLEAARLKSDGLKNARWIEDDMRSFDLGQVFGLIIIPGHSFQNLLTAADQITCLRSIKRHLAPPGRLVMHLDHQDVDWLGALMGAAGGVFEPAEEFAHPKTGRQVRTSRAWWYERSTQTAIVQTIWEEIGESQDVVNRVDSGKIRIHCVFPFEMEHMVRLAGLTVEHLFGDFERSAFSDQAEEMICVAIHARDGAGG